MRIRLFRDRPTHRVAEREEGMNMLVVICLVIVLLGGLYLVIQLRSRLRQTEEYIAKINSDLSKLWEQIQEIYPTLR